MFGDRDSGAYLAKFAWTKIVRYTLVKGRSSPDEPVLIQYLPASPQGLLEPDAVKVASPVLRGPGAVMRSAYLTFNPPANHTPDPDNIK
ncbi:hypothetical protein [Kribbella qitaiheensis]|uniref:hypothetical protein n=1 Tax=Kribbella qitaiheensis TaxID=1544730 RepID=UPI0019D5B6FD|nr:hypothetical protein [Kribbella qitaiheensis]